MTSSSKAWSWGGEIFTDIRGLGATDFYLLHQERIGKPWAQLCLVIQGPGNPGLYLSQSSCLIAFGMYFLFISKHLDSFLGRAGR